MFKFLKKITKNGWEGLKRQGFLTFATSLVIFIAATLAISLYLFQGGVSYLTSTLDNQIDISVTFNADVSQDQILSMRDDLLKLSQVKKIDYVSAEDAYNTFVSSHQGDKYMQALEMIGTNPFLPSLRVQTKDPSQYSQVTAYFAQGQYKSLVAEVNDYKKADIIARLTEITRSIRLMGIAVTVFLSLIAVVITFNTLRLSIYSQKEEIEIMRLVGAKNNFIRGPFLVEGVFCGFFASVLSFILYFILLFSFSGQLKSLFMGFDIYGFFLGNVWLVLLCDFGVGLGLGLISSYFAVRKYLRN
jgi:cell division transport system permease protein